MNGLELLNEYRDRHSDQAFTEIVRQYSGLVFSVARRQIQDNHLAEEVMQVVFSRLAQAAPKLASEGALAGWLHRTTLHVSIDLWRAETRRRVRELKAFMTEPHGPEPQSSWDELAPHLDQALNELGETDRQTLLLRFFQRLPMRELGRTLEISENAAKMRVGRALERLRSRLEAKGVACGTAALTALLRERAVDALPSSLVAATSATAALALKSAGLSAAKTSTWLPLILMSNLKVASVVLVGCLAIGLLGYRLAVRSRPGIEPGVSGAAPSAVPQVMNRPGVPNPLERALSRVAAADLAAVEQLKSELRRLLEHPDPSRQYPPVALRALLAKFGGQALEAVPVLLEAIAKPDYETRLWAASGLRVLIAGPHESPERLQIAEQAFAAARPALAEILRSPKNPDLLRMVALESFLPPPFDGPGDVARSSLFLPGAVEDLVAALKVPDKEGLRFTIVDRVASQLVPNGEEAKAFVGALRPNLESANANERFLAAYALASWPGEKGDQVKQELLAQIKAHSIFGHHAADGLARLGPAAADAVPALLEYAEATKSWAAGYADRALEAASRLSPEVRAQHPEIDQRLKLEESAVRGVQVTPVSLSDWITSLAKAGEQQLERGLVGNLQNSENAEAAKQTLIAALQEALSHASEDQKPALQRAIDIAGRASTPSGPSESVPSRQVSIVSLVMDARVLLTDSPPPRSAQLEQALDSFHSSGRETVTAESYSKLAKALRDVDPVFEAQWREAILKTYPWLDRVLPVDGKK